jgi:predicted NBD/HSP70 family sugar kinase
VHVEPRSVIAARLDMHNAVVTRLVRELIMFGCLDENEAQLAARGRPVVPLTVSGRIGYAAGAMAHPGWIELVLVDFAGKVLARHQEPFNDPDPRAFIELVGRRLRELAARSDVIGSRFLGLGVAIPGPVTQDGPTRRWTVKWLEGWRDVDHPEYFETYLGSPVWVENESTLAGLAAFIDCGLLERCRSAISIFVGHGVGGSIISRRDILSGEYGNAGDLGRLYPSLDNARPSGIDLLKTINAAGGNLLSLLEIGDHLDRYADVIRSWVERASDQLAGLAASGAAWLDPGAIIVTGSLPVPILEAIGSRLAEAEWIFGLTAMPRPTFHVSALGSWAVPIGAAMLPIHDLISADE